MPSLVAIFIFVVICLLFGEFFCFLLFFGFLFLWFKKGKKGVSSLRPVACVCVCFVVCWFLPLFEHSKRQTLLDSLLRSTKRTIFLICITTSTKITIPSTASSFFLSPVVFPSGRKTNHVSFLLEPSSSSLVNSSSQRKAFSVSWQTPCLPTSVRIPLALGLHPLPRSSFPFTAFFLVLLFFLSLCRLFLPLPSSSSHFDKNNHCSIDECRWFGVALVSLVRLWFSFRLYSLASNSRKLCVPFASWISAWRHTRYEMLSKAFVHWWQHPSLDHISPINTPLSMENKDIKTWVVHHRSILYNRFVLQEPFTLTSGIVSSMATGIKLGDDKGQNPNFCSGRHCVTAVFTARPFFFCLCCCCTCDQKAEPHLPPLRCYVILLRQA